MILTDVLRLLQFWWSIMFLNFDYIWFLSLRSVTPAHKKKVVCTYLYVFWGAESESEVYWAPSSTDFAKIARNNWKRRKIVKNRENHISKRDKIRKNFFWPGSSMFLMYFDALNQNLQHKIARNSWKWQKIILMRVRKKSQKTAKKEKDWKSWIAKNLEKKCHRYELLRNKFYWLESGFLWCCSYTFFLL